MISWLFAAAQWLLRRWGIANVLTFGLVGVALYSVVTGLGQIIRDFDRGFMLQLMAIGLLLSWTLARRSISSQVGGLLLTGLGLTGIIFRVGRLDKPLFAFIAELVSRLRLWFAGQAVDLSPVGTAVVAFWIDLEVILSRLITWATTTLVDNQPFDPAASTIAWAFVIWGVTIWAGWIIQRHNHPLLALLPAGLLLMAVRAFSRAWPTALLVFLAACLLLMTLEGQRRRELRWQQQKVSYPVEVRTDLSLAVVPLTVALVMIAAGIGLFSTGPLYRVIQQSLGGPPPDQGRALASSLGIESSAFGIANRTLIEARQGGLPQSHLLGSGPELSGQVVMTIQTNDPPPQISGAPPPRYYWRSLTYDRYTGRGWQTRSTEAQRYEAGAATDIQVGDNQRLLQQTVQGTDRFSGLLYVAGEVADVDQSYVVDWRNENDIFGATVDDVVYQAESYLTIATEAELRQAGDDYPAWVTRHYLALPDSVPQRVRSLARDLTATSRTPYDQAKTIEQYLRTFPYNLDLPSPPSDRDITDYFLFDLQQGYCDYYATSMIVMARSVGIPARLAVGYIHGAYDPEQDQYTVTEAEGHSWVEVYFPNIGWINFEPTGGRPAIERDSAGQAPDFAVRPPPPLPPVDETPRVLGRTLTGWASALTWPLGMIILSVMALLAWNRYDEWQLRRLSPVGTIETLHQRLYRHGQRLGASPVRGDTPYQFSASLIKLVEFLAKRSRWVEFIRPANQEIEQLITLIVRTAYSPRQADLAEQQTAIETWYRLRRRLWLAWLVSRLKPAPRTESL